MTTKTSPPAPAQKTARKAQKDLPQAKNTAKVAAGRDESDTIRRYLEALQSTGGLAHSRTVETVQRELQGVRWQIVIAEPDERAALAQERIDLEAELEALSNIDKVDLAALEQGFIACAATYSAREGITHAAWRSVGIEPKVLTKAGIATTKP
jgi:hypothetical protein